MADPGSLQNLHDILVPQPAPYWPPAPGWYVAFACAAFVAVWFCWRLFRNWRANAYRRAALVELSRLRALIAKGERELAMRKFPELIKRTAMAVWPRKQVAPLTGCDCLQFLDKRGNTNLFTGDDGRLLADMAYAGTRKLNMITDDQMRALLQAAENWIRKHRANQAVVKEIAGANNE